MPRERRGLPSDEASLARSPSRPSIATPASQGALTANKGPVPRSLCRSTRGTVPAKSQDGRAKPCSTHEWVCQGMPMLGPSGCWINAGSFGRTPREASSPRTQEPSSPPAHEHPSPQALERPRLTCTAPHHPTPSGPLWSASTSRCHVPSRLRVGQRTHRDSGRQGRGAPQWSPYSLALCWCRPRQPYSGLPYARGGIPPQPSKPQSPRTQDRDYQSAQEGRGDPPLSSPGTQPRVTRRPNPETQPPGT